MRYADILANQGWRNPNGGQPIDPVVTEFLRSGIDLYTIIDATNVYEYVKGLPGMDLYDLPCAAPPDPLLIVEWRQHNDRGVLLHAVANDTREHPFVIGDRVPDKTAKANGYRKLRPLDGSRRQHPPEMWLSDYLPNQLAWDNIRWTWTIDMFQEHNGTIFGPFACTCAALNEWGELIDVAYEAKIPSDDDMLQKTSIAPFSIFMHTLNFMQCANIQTEYIEPSEKLSRKHRKKGHIQKNLLGYHVLRIAAKGPATKTKSAKDGQSAGNLVAFHPVRGEFHHYGDCCPGRHAPKGLLFGKHTGRVWVPGHVRGNPDRGTITRDFEIKPIEEVPWEPTKS
jgi:hypothetical protein